MERKKSVFHQNTYRFIGMDDHFTGELWLFDLINIAGMKLHGGNEGDCVDAPGSITGALEIQQ